MRISAIAPVGRSDASPVDPVSWYGSSGVQGVEANAGAPKGAFLKVLKQLEEEPHRLHSRVVEVMFAPGLNNGGKSRYIKLSSFRK